MKKFTKILSITLVVGLLGIMGGCATKNSTKATSKKKQLVIGFSSCTLNNPFFVDEKNGATKEASDNNAKIIVTDAQNQASQQQTDVENLIQKKPDVLIIDPCDSNAIKSAIQEANDAKIPVITIDRASNGGKVVSYIGYDAITAGKMAGEYLGKTLNGKGKVVEIMGTMGTNVAQDRSKGFEEAISKYPGIKIIAKQTANFDRSDAMTVMENILQANPKIDGVYCANDEMALGAVSAITSANRMSKITLVGNDAIDDTLASIKAGKQTATIAEPPFALGKTAVEDAIKLINGGKIQAKITLPSTLVTKENVNSIKTRD